MWWPMVIPPSVGQWDDKTSFGINVRIIKTLSTINHLPTAMYGSSQLRVNQLYGFLGHNSVKLWYLWYQKKQMCTSCSKIDLRYLLVRSVSPLPAYISRTLLTYTSFTAISILYTNTNTINTNNTNTTNSNTNTNTTNTNTNSTTAISQ